MYSNLRPLLLTTDDRVVLLEELEKLSKSFFASDPEHYKKVLETEVRHTVQAELETLINGTDAKNEVEDLIAFVRGLPIIRLTLAFSPTREQLARFASILDTNDSFCLFELEVNASIVGGLQLSVNGKYKDYSLARKLQEFFATSHQRIVHTDYP